MYAFCKTLTSSFSAPLPPFPPGFRTEQDLHTKVGVEPVGFYTVFMKAMVRLSAQPRSGKAMEESIRTSLSPDESVTIFRWVGRNLQPGHVILALYVIVSKMI